MTAAAAKNGELRHFDAEEAFTKMYTFKILEEYQEFQATGSSSGQEDACST